MNKSMKSLWAVLIATFIIAGMNSCQKEFFKDHTPLIEKTESYAAE